uniref:Uncharacterized protein n=1 Tax=Quercus lobata TaxID=97700 RepID=A0A7N2MCI3_QUELO
MADMQGERKEILSLEFGVSLVSTLNLFSPWTDSATEPIRLKNSPSVMMMMPITQSQRQVNPSRGVVAFSVVTVGITRWIQEERNFDAKIGIWHFVIWVIWNCGSLSVFTSVVFQMNVTTTYQVNKMVILQSFKKFMLKAMYNLYEHL